MNLQDVKPGLKIVTNKRLEDTRGMFVAERHLRARDAGLAGTVKGFVPGHGGDVW